MKTTTQQITELLIASNPLIKKLSANQLNITCPPSEKFGDYSTNLALIFSKAVGQPPALLAKQIVESPILLNSPVLSKLETAGPGFINLFLSDNYLLRQVDSIIKLGDKYCRINVGQKQKIMIEFISANPTGPLTVGNARGGYIGDVLGNILINCGYRVTKEYYVNDTGNQILALGHSVLKDSEQVYRGDYIDKLNKLNKLTDPYRVGQASAKKILTEYIQPAIQNRMGVKFDVWFSENANLHKKNKINPLLQYLKKSGLAFEQDGAWWFASTKFGDDKDRVLIKKDGEATYFAVDFAYHQNKFQRGFKKVINIWGADHHGDINRIMAAAEVLGRKNDLQIIITQFVRLIKDGKEVRMSKRAGNLVLIDDLIAEVGPDAARFNFLRYCASSHIDFDLNLIKERSEKNPIYYVQYAYARICSLLKQKELQKPPKLREFAFTAESEKKLVKELIKLPDLLIEVAKNYQTQNLITYAVKLADTFHQFYANCRVISNGQVNWSRVKIIKATKIIFKSLLDVAGLGSPEKM